MSRKRYTPEQIIVRGPADALDAWLRIAREGYRPWRRVYGIPDECAEVPDYLPRPAEGDGRQGPTAFVCRGLQCSPPVDALDEFRSVVG